jgi:energy-converting hydrogenase Eha subunit E
MKLHQSDKFDGRLALGQAAYFLVTGIWPLVDLRTFEAISGPKVDDWLVKTVGVQIGVVGGVLALAAYRQRVTPEVELLAIGSALGLAAIDVVYVSRRRIRPIYLLDALIELGFVAGWAVARRGRSQ